MTVKELITELEKCRQEAEISVFVEIRDALNEVTVNCKFNKVLEVNPGIKNMSYVTLLGYIE